MAEFPVKGEMPWGAKMRAYIDATVAAGGGTPENHQHAPSDIGAATETHTHTSGDVGAIPASDVTRIEVVTQAEYDALGVKPATTLYVIEG